MALHAQGVTPRLSFMRLVGKIRIEWLLILPSALMPHASGSEAPRHWPPDQFAPVTMQRIAALPSTEQPVWIAYWKASQKLATRFTESSIAEDSPSKPISGPPIGALHYKGLRFDAPPDWYATEEARAIADNVVTYQTSVGGWTKGNDYIKPLASRGKPDAWSRGTFDNDATIYEMRFLALVNAASPKASHSAEWRKSFLRGLDYVFASQYPNGGFPQIYPLVGGYHDNITFNDDAMTHVLQLLRHVGAKEPEYAFVSTRLRKQAQLRMKRGVQCILASQIKSADGRRTVWCQQHDALTLEPAAARNFEPVAACSAESATITKFLMSLPNPSPEIVQAVEDAMAWFRRTEQRDIIWSRFTNNTQVVVSPGAPPLWARFYELDTDKPIFGDRDRTIHYGVSEISSERRAGYAWYGDWPAIALEMYESWRKNIQPLDSDK